MYNKVFNINLGRVVIYVILCSYVYYKSIIVYVMIPFCRIIACVVSKQ